MTEKQLKQYRGLLVEINELERQIDDIKRKSLVTDTVTSSDADSPYLNHCIKIKGIDVDRKAELLKKQEQLTISKNKAFKMQNEIEQFIDSIEDDTYIRNILRMKYIEGKSWLNIAMRYGFVDEAVPRMKVKRFLKKLKKS